MFSYRIDDELSLKLPEPKDAERVFELTDNSRKYLREWLPWLDFTVEVKDTEDFIKAGRLNYAQNQSMNTVIVYKGEIVGMAGYNSLDWGNRIAKIGYWLGHEYQGNGIMTRVVRALTEYAINSLRMNKVEIRVAVGNMKSRRIPEHLDYVEEGTLRQMEWLYDHYVDHVVYGMLADEWNKTN